MARAAIATLVLGSLVGALAACKEAAPAASDAPPLKPSPAVLPAAASLAPAEDGELPPVEISRVARATQAPGAPGAPTGEAAEAEEARTAPASPKDCGRALNRRFQLAVLLRRQEHEASGKSWDGHARNVAMRGLRDDHDRRMAFCRAWMKMHHIQCQLDAPDLTAWEACKPTP